ncbi:MAG: ATP-binding protein [Cardiobacteriaceae bacterium]|nr:ATP-binding protein [Cardiobacteriaceae bacterium]
MYISRQQETTLRRIAQQFPALLLSGARQVGKSTLLKEVFSDYSYLTFDDPMLRQQAQIEPFLFINSCKLPTILDEVQYAPEIFSLIKMELDTKKKNGLFLLSGSQAFELMKNVQETLAGRIAILKLGGLSLREINHDEFFKPFIPNLDYLDNRNPIENNKNIWQVIHQGSMPRLYEQETDWGIYYASYVATYIERDIRQIINVENTANFSKFMSAIAARSGELLNYSNIAQEVEISIETVKRWLSVLQASGIIYLLKPYANNHLKRAIKTPKVYMTDTGLMAYLSKWTSPETIQTGAKSGQFFETFVINEIIKSFYNNGKEPPIYFYRDTNQKDIDLIIEDGQNIYPIEIKSTGNPNKKMAASFKTLQKTVADKNIKEGIIICQYPKKILLAEDLISIPYFFI